MAVRVELAGRVRLLVGGTVIDGRAMGGAIAQRVVAVLALAGGPVSRDELGDAVWGETLPRTWETALRGAVHRLRRAVADADPSAAEPIRTAFGAYQLDPAITVDVLEAGLLVERAERELRDHPQAALHSAAQAAGMLAHPLLAGLDGEWIDQERARRAPLRTRAHLTRSAAASALGDHASAVAAARAAVDDDPYAELGHRRLMIAHAASGDRGAALAAYQRCRALLAAELGVEPSPDTDAVRHAVLDDRVAARAAPVLPVGLPDSLGRDLPLAGRAALLAGVGRSTGTAGCVLVGPAGVGKSRLAAEVAWTRHDSGAAVIHARIEPDDLGGLGAFAELLGQLDVAWPPPELTVSSSVLVDRAQLADAAITALRDAAARRALVIVLDDLHWADRSTAALLERVVAARIEDVFLVATAREEWLEPSPAGRAELATSLDILEVTPLDPEGTADLVAAWAGQRPGATVVDAIMTRTGGNPFYTLAVLQDLAGRGGTLAHGLEITADLVDRIPAGVSGIVDAALDRAGADARAYAEAAAVLGEDPHGAAVTDMLGIGLVPGTALVQRLMTGRLLTRSPHDPGRLRWVHALVRDAVLAGLTVRRRTQLHRLAYDALERHHDASPSLVLRHLVASAQPADAARISELATAVADDLIDRGRGDEARAALQDALGAVDDASDVRRAPLLMTSAMAELSMDRVVEGRRQLTEAATVAVAGGDAAFLDHWWSAVSSRAAGAADPEMVALVERLIELTEPESRRRATALGWLAVELSVGPDMERAHEAGAAALAIARRLADPVLLRQIVHMWHLAARVEVPAASRRAVVEEVLALPDRAGKRAADVLGWVTLAGDCVQLGDADGAARAVDAAMTATDGFEATHLRWIALRSDVMLATMVGRLEHAEAASEAAAAIAAAMPWPDAPGIQVLQHIMVRYHQGRLDEVQPFMAAVVEAAPDQVGALVALAFIEAELGHDHAAAAVDDVVARLPSLTSASSWLGTTAVVVESMAKVGHPRVAEVAAGLAPWSGEHAVITTLCYFGAVDRVLGLAAAAGGERERAIHLLQRAIDQHEAIGAPLYAARTRHELARLG